MRFARVLAAVALLSGCARAITPFPPFSNPGAAFSQAQEAVERARRAGADSLAPAPFLAARAYLSEAEHEAQQNDIDHAAVRARQATAEADYARALAGQVLAERARAAARAALGAVTDSATSP